jgi:glucose-6-phosphate 1-dehydrogenase
MNTTTNFPQAGAVDIVIFGGAGDLSFRKLLPALYMAHLHTRLEMNTRIIAVGRQKWTRDEYLAFIDKHSPAFIEESAFTAPDWRVFLNRLSYVSMDVTQADDYDKLKVVLLGDRAGFVHANLRAALSGGVDRCAIPCGAGEALGPGPGVGSRHQYGGGALF